MKLTTGTVVHGKVVVDGSALPEGLVVAVLAHDGNDEFEVPPELVPELEESLAQAARGETIPIAEVMARLRNY